MIKSDKTSLSFSSTSIFEIKIFLLFTERLNVFMTMQLMWSCLNDFNRKELDNVDDRGKLCKLQHLPE